MHPWQGEHLGKWLHAGVIAYKITGNEKIKKAMDEMVNRVLATQRADGYIGTYADEYTFMMVPESTDPKSIADDAKYYNEAEITLLNSVHGHQEMEEKEWCYTL